MRRLSSLALAAAAVFAVSSAQALVLVVDDFNAPPATVFDAIGGDAIVASDASAARTIYHKLLTNVANPTGLVSSVRVGAASFPPGTLAMANASTINSEVTLQWGLAPGFVPLTGPLSFLFKVYDSDAVQKTLTFTIGATTVAAFNIGASGVADISFSPVLTPAQRAALNAGGTLGVTVTGNDAWDLSLDQFALIVPEPTSLALVGLALLGAGVASRRRQA